MIRSVTIRNITPRCLGIVVNKQVACNFSSETHFYPVVVNEPNFKGILFLSGCTTNIVRIASHEKYFNEIETLVIK